MVVFNRTRLTGQLIRKHSAFGGVLFIFQSFLVSIVFPSVFLPAYAAAAPFSSGEKALLAEGRPVDKAYTDRALRQNAPKAQTENEALPGTPYAGRQGFGLRDAHGSSTH